MSVQPLAPSTPRTWAEFIPPAARVQAGVLIALLVAMYWGPLRRDLIWTWTNDGNWSHGWLVPVFSLYFLVVRKDELFRCRVRPSYLGAVVLAGALALYFAGWWWRFGYPQSVSMVGAIFGVVLLLAGWQVIRLAWFPILYLLLAVPLPQGIYERITRPLREWASYAASMILPLLVDGYYAAQGAVIDFKVPGGAAGTLNVEEACSGMRMIMAFTALGLAMAYLGDRPLWQRVVMVFAVLPIAVFCNTIRVVVTGLLYVTGHQDWAQGTAHQSLGLVMLFLALGLFWLVGLVLERLFVEVPEPVGESGDGRM